MTFIEDARRAQILDAAIRVIAEQGYAAASMGRIAERIDVSRALINYHFRTRTALIDAVVEDCYAAGHRAIRPAMDASGSAAGMLDAFIAGSVAFYRAEPHRIGALGEIIAGTLKSDYRPVAARLQGELDALALLFQEGQRAGEFRTFDPAIMAGVVRGALDGLLRDWARDPGLDLDHYRDELITTLRQATHRRRPRT